MLFKEWKKGLLANFTAGYSGKFTPHFEEVHTSTSDENIFTELFFHITLCFVFHTQYP